MVPEDFELEKTLGTGAFSKVLMARYTPDDRRFAVKMIAKRQILNASTEEEKKRMADVARREMRILLMCDHPSIIRFYASMQTNDDLMFVTELCSGGELLDAIKRRGRIPLAAARYVLAEVLSALRYLHSAEKRTYPIVPNGPLKRSCILHRDIKPENIMLTETKHVKLIDFGTATVCETADEHPKDERSFNTTKVRAQTFCGTTYYMAPELLQDNYTCTASDIWGCGCVFYHMLSGQKPFDAATQYLLIKKILEEEVVFPEGFDPTAKDLCARMLDKDPTRRITMEAIVGHPFFDPIKSWDELHTLDVRKYWVKDAEWQKDNIVTECPACQKPFSVFRRRHHCRNCGGVYCADCSAREILIPESTYATQERVCDSCFTKLSHR